MYPVVLFQTRKKGGRFLNGINIPRYQSPLLITLVAKANEGERQTKGINPKSGHQQVANIILVRREVNHFHVIF